MTSTTVIQKLKYDISYVEQRFQILSLSSEDPLKRVETAMMLEALAERVTLGKRAKQVARVTLLEKTAKKTARDALAQVFATQKDLDAFCR
jgi:hypothetical protein